MNDSVLRQWLAVSIFIMTDLSQFATVFMAVVILQYLKIPIISTDTVLKPRYSVIINKPKQIEQNTYNSNSQSTISYLSPVALKYFFVVISIQAKIANEKHPYSGLACWMIVYKQVNFQAIIPIFSRETVSQTNSN